MTTETLLEYPMARSCPFDPPPELIRVQEQERIRRVTLWDGSNPWLITGYDEVREILSDPRMSADTERPGYPFTSMSRVARRRLSKTFVWMDNPEHDELRRMLTRDFTVSRIRAMRPRIQQIVDGLIDAMLAGPKPTDLVEAFALPLPSLVICEMLGVPYGDSHLFQQLSNTMISRLSTAEQAVEAARGMQELLGRVIDQKDKNPQDDIISRLVVEQLRTGGLQRDEILNMCQLLLVAGHDTTANQVALSTLIFLQNPEILETLRTTDDPDLIANAVEELLRYVTLLQIGRSRVATEDFDFHGHKIKAGDGAIVALDGANRDPAVFENPHQIDITRKARHHVAFGFGIHQCLGQPLARIELEVVYSTLYRRIPALALAIPLDQIEFKNHSIAYGVNALPVRW